jgi:hypothetical protein
MSKFTPSTTTKISSFNTMGRNLLTLSVPSGFYANWNGLRSSGFPLKTSLLIGSTIEIYSEPSTHAMANDLTYSPPITRRVGSIEISMAEISSNGPLSRSIVLIDFRFFHREIPLFHNL